MIEDWIAQGAEWPGQMDEVATLTTDHWSFQSPVRPEVPGGAASPVDAFLNSALAGAGLKPNPPTDAHSLIRRVSIVLTGLPPTPERAAQFVRNHAEDAESAYSELVDELMASPHFGERWAQHWLDVIRWAETNGSESNLYRKNAWIYRDYVIRAFNEDLPYNQFIREQIAGDQMGAGEATGFLVAGPHVPAATVGREESRNPPGAGGSDGRNLADRRGISDGRHGQLRALSQSQIRSDHDPGLLRPERRFPGSRVRWSLAGILRRSPAQAARQRNLPGDGQTAGDSPERGWPVAGGLGWLP